MAVSLRALPPPVQAIHIIHGATVSGNQTLRLKPSNFQYRRPLPFSFHPPHLFMLPSRSHCVSNIATALSYPMCWMLDSLALCWLCVRVISLPPSLIHVFFITTLPVRAQSSLMCSAESSAYYSLLNPSLRIFCTAQIPILYFCRYYPLLPLLHQSIAPYHLTLPGTSNVRWQMKISTCVNTSCAATDDQHVGECSPLQTPSRSNGGFPERSEL